MYRFICNDTYLTTPRSLCQEDYGECGWTPQERYQIPKVFGNAKRGRMGILGEPRLPECPCGCVCAVCVAENGGDVAGDEGEGLVVCIVAVVAQVHFRTTSTTP